MTCSHAMRTIKPFRVNQVRCKQQKLKPLHSSMEYEVTRSRNTLKCESKITTFANKIEGERK